MSSLLAALALPYPKCPGAAGRKNHSFLSGWLWFMVFTKSKHLGCKVRRQALNTLDKTSLFHQMIPFMHELASLQIEEKPQTLQINSCTH